jgi:hypothetical protein
MIDVGTSLWRTMIPGIGGGLSPINFSRNFTTGTLGSSPTFVRTSTATVEHNTGDETLIVPCLANEARFEGLRRILNLCRISSDFSDAVWSVFSASKVGATVIDGVSCYEISFDADTSAGLYTNSYNGSYYPNGVDYLITAKIRSKSGNQTVRYVASPTSATWGDDTTITEEWQVISDIITPSQFGSIGIRNGTAGAAKDFYIAWIQVEMVEGHTDQTFADYVSVGVLSAPYHGANVDGVKYFNTDKSGSALDVSSAGLLMEPVATNLILKSEGPFDDIEWANQRAVIAANSTASPRGIVDATKITDDSSTGTNTVFIKTAASLTVSTSSSYTLSIYAKQDQLSWIYLRTDGFTTPGVGRTWFDIGTGAVGTEYTDHSGSIEDVGNGWYRCAITFTTDATDTTGTVTIGLAEADEVFNVDLDGTSSVYVWGAQFEAGSAPTSYITTSGAAASRAADSLIYSGSWTSDNETRAVVDEADVDVDDWDGVVDDAILGADNTGVVGSITVYETGKRPA